MVIRYGEQGVIMLDNVTIGFHHTHDTTVLPEVKQEKEQEKEQENTKKTKAAAVVPLEEFRDVEIAVALRSLDLKAYVTLRLYRTKFPSKAVVSIGDSTELAVTAGQPFIAKVPYKIPVCLFFYSDEGYACKGDAKNIKIFKSSFSRTITNESFLQVCHFLF